VVIEEAVEEGESLGFGLACFPRRGWDGRGQADGLAATPPHVHLDVAVFDERDVVEEQTGHAFAFALGGGGV
jgi:hypothetical protein